MFEGSKDRKEGRVRSVANSHAIFEPRERPRAAVAVGRVVCWVRGDEIAMGLGYV